MVWNQKEKNQPCARESVKPNAFGRILGIFKARFIGTLSCSSSPLSYEEIKALKTHQLEIERRRSLAIEYQRRTMFRQL